MGEFNLLGQRIGQYVLSEGIGRGAMGEVYLAQDLARGEYFAIKVLNAAHSQEADFVKRFRREMQLMQSLDHPNVMPLFDASEHQGFPYIVMPYIDGPTLERLMRQRRFSPATAWNVLKPLIEGLEHGHERGILHRDVKPGNVIFKREPNNLSLYLMDFGLGKRVDMDRSVTTTGTSIGTPEYMSPEAAQGLAMDQRSDVYSLACVAYELLLGVVPFDLKTPYRIAMAQVYDAPPPMQKHNPAMPAALDKVILKSLEKTMEERHQSVRAFGEDFYNALMGLSAEEQRADYWII